MLFSPEMMVKFTNGVIYMYTNAYVCDYSFNAVIFTDDAFLGKQRNTILLSITVA